MSKLNVGQNAGYTKSKNDSVPENYPNTIVEAVYWDDKKKLLSEALSDIEKTFDDKLDTKLEAPDTQGQVGQVLQLAQNGKSAWVDAATGGTYDGALSDSSTNAPQNKVVTAKLSELGHEVGGLKDTTGMVGKWADISSQEQRIQGYALTTGEFVGIGSASQRLIYVPVYEGKRYRFKGTYAVVSGYADIIFSQTIPTTGDFGVVIDSGKADGTSFDITYSPTADGYVFIFGKNGNTYYDAFFEEIFTSKVDDLEVATDNIKTAIDYSESAVELATSPLKGYVNSSPLGEFERVNDPDSPITMQYLAVDAGVEYRIVGKHTSYSYPGLVFTEQMPATNSYGIIVAAKTPSADFDEIFTPDLDGYLFIYAASFVVTKKDPDKSVVTRQEIFADCIVNQVKIVGVAYQRKYISTSTKKVVDTNSNGSYIISVIAGEKYLVRGSVMAYGSYAVVGFSESLTDGAAAEVLVSVPSGPVTHDYEYVFTAKRNGYLFAWSTTNVYGSARYVEIFKLAERQKEIYDYYLPASLKIQIFGDSISDSYWGDYSSWVNYIADNIVIDSLTIENSAVGGASIGGGGEYSVPVVIEDGYQRTDGRPFAKALEADADFVVVFAGTNDWGGGHSLSSTTSALADAFQHIFENSKAKVLFCTPLQRYNSTDAGRPTNADGVPLNSENITLREECDALIAVCQRFSVQVLDLNADANINRYNILDYSEDGLHPHRDGDIYVSWLICKKIKEMLRG